MRVKGLVWLGLRTAQFEETVQLFRNVMGMELIRDEPEIAGFKLMNNTEVEVYRPEEEFHSFFTSGPVVAFLVENVDEARATMEAAGIEFIGPIQRSGSTSWNHFRAPDGTVFEILSVELPWLSWDGLAHKTVAPELAPIHGAYADILDLASRVGSFE